ncbi:hypothetical protein BD324DRAFT_611731 [Kockovaella imperatae]|uniref:Outer membrane protein TOM13-domain-containing protein n=1 Tax=Kockovaella imperatae TaxID=4999 RepID=A0A1Y1URH9_9TREE|nr:hypothetical protein BD324DRAFT_611731 [Kockovaella imperatae]ORX40668.1 hypothetical protein BD324DRAFT_611731 [Kockovaella imperatae]
MSDTRNDADQELVSAGMASGMEDSLGSILGNSFSIPKPTPKPTADSERTKETSAESEAAEAPTIQDDDVPGMDTWKETYEGYLSHWQAESAEAREKALQTREKYEREEEERQKASSGKTAAEKKEQQRQAKLEADAERLRMELEGGTQAGSSSSNKGRASSVVDGRGVTDEDRLAGQALSVGQSRPEVKQTAYDPTTSTEPLPPSMKQSMTSSSSPYDPSSPSSFHKIESGTLSRHSATSQAWEEISGHSSSPDQASPHGQSEDDDMVRISRPGSQRPGGPPSGPPAQPPSLTLSLFTGPSGSMSFPRILAVLGINLVLPFINGVMLGFGEIFAREFVKVGRIWWRTGGNFWAMMMGQEEPRGFGGARGVSGVGLRGNGY